VPVNSVKRIGLTNSLLDRASAESISTGGFATTRIGGRIRAVDKKEQAG
jgi:hypothetical protein